MNSKSIISLVMQLPLLAGICAAEESKPNIVPILADDLGYRTPWSLYEPPASQAA